MTSEHRPLEINKVFYPSSALRKGQRDRFIGRGDLISRAIGTLATRGTTLAIIGERGIGKTSLAERLREYVRGDHAWVDDNIGTLGITFPDSDVAWIDVSKYHHDFFGVIIDLVTSTDRGNDDSILSDIVKIAQEGDIVGELISKIEPEKLRIFKANLEKAKGNVEIDDDVKPLPIAEGNQRAILDIFRRMLSKVAQQRNRNLVIFLDEFDQLVSKEGLGQFLKVGTETPDGLSAQFVLVGVADDINHIGLDHDSAERKIRPISVERFTLDEVRAFLQSLNESLYESNLVFSDDIVEPLFDYSDGFPSMCQRLTTDAAMRKISAPRSSGVTTKIELTDFDVALNTFLDPKIDQGNRYRKLREGVNNSNQENILFKLSEFASGWVSYDELKGKLKSNYRFITSLSRMHEQKIIVDHNNYVRFFDPQMRAIVKLALKRNVKLYNP